MAEILSGKVAVVTGSTGGIGLVLARSLSNAGATVVLSGRTAERVEAAQREVSPRAGGEVWGRACDVRSLTQVEALARDTLDRFGHIDVWVNNAGIAGPYGPGNAIPPEDWQAVMETNLNGTFYGTRVALQHMLPRKQGKLINLIGAGSRERGRLPLYMSAYATTKAGILRFTQVLAEEHRGSGVSILAMSPGFTRTGLMENIHTLTPEAARHVKQLDSALDSFGTPIEAAGELVVRLAGPETDGVTGKMYAVKPGGLQIARGILGRILRRR